MKVEAILKGGKSYHKNETELFVVEGIPGNDLAEWSSNAWIIFKDILPSGLSRWRRKRLTPLGFELLNELMKVKGLAGVRIGVSVLSGKYNPRYVVQVGYSNGISSSKRGEIKEVISRL